MAADVYPFTATSQLFDNKWGDPTGVIMKRLNNNIPTTYELKWIFRIGVASWSRSIIGKIIYKTEGMGTMS